MRSIMPLRSNGIMCRLSGMAGWRGDRRRTGIAIELELQSPDAAVVRFLSALVFSLNSVHPLCLDTRPYSTQLWAIFLLNSTLRVCVCSNPG